MMSKCYSIGDLMSVYYEKEFSSAGKMPSHEFSARHKRRMKKAFNIFAQNIQDRNKQRMKTEASRPLSLRKRIMLATIIIFMLCFVMGCVIAFVSGSFRGTVYSSNTNILALYDGNSPAAIEKQYKLSIVPDGYKLSDVTSSSISQFVIYENGSNQELIFEQTVKSKYDSHINTEGYAIEKIQINGCNAIAVEYERQQGVQSLIVWDNDDYVLMLYGNFTKKELMDLAISNEIEGF